MKKTHNAVALMAAFAFAGLTLAATPTTAPVPAPGNSTDEVQHLRDARKHLNDAKDEFLKYPKDKANHRQEVLEGIDKALTAIDSEINELKK